MARLTFSRGCMCCDAPAISGRRGFLTGAAAVAGLSATGLAAPAAAQAKPFRIDIHHHVYSPSWVAALQKAKLDSPPINNWTPEKSLAEMERGGIATAILSVTQPAMSFVGAAEAAALARASNEYAKGLAQAHPGRFGIFAVLPMPYIDESLAEIAYALDTLKADGIGLLTSYGTKFLGDPAFTPVLEELNRRKVTVYTHPADPSCCQNLAGLPGQIIEFGTDTTRTIASLIFSRAAERTHDINWIFSHAGGTLTSLVERFTVQLPGLPQYKTFNSGGVYAELKRFNYDTAQAANPMTLGALTQFIAASNILFGTDYPYRNAPDQVAGLDAFFGPADLRLIERGNAERLLPAWKAT
jgi:predicted TIM-barrel fold metal-dependent hydrolase